LKRREFVKRLVVSSFLIATSTAAMYEMLARYNVGQQQQQQTQTIQSQQQSLQTTQSNPIATSQFQTSAGYVFVTAASSLAGKTSIFFNHPTYGSSLLINVSGKWKAFSSTCTHQTCTVQYGGGSSIRCPCHGATFSTSNGSVLGGPAPRPLPEYGVQVDNNGNLFVTTAAIN
jgi:Rieske Fe-S protein